MDSNASGMPGHVIHVDFLGRVARDESTNATLARKPTRGVRQPLITDELLVDIENLSRTELRAKYSHEANTHRNLRPRVRRRGRGRVHIAFRDFGSFLMHVGICPDPTWTLDRTDNRNPDYGPGLCRWASPRDQASNRSNNVLLTVSGDTRTLTAWARDTGQSPSTLRARRARGWNDHEVVHGRQHRASDPDCWKSLLVGRVNKSLKEIEAEYQASGHGSRASWLRDKARRRLQDIESMIVENLNEHGRADPGLQRQYDLWQKTLANLR